MIFGQIINWISFPFILQLTIETSPDNALFAVNFNFDVISNVLNLNGDFSLINPYGSQPYCFLATRPELRNYCLCRLTSR